MFAKKHKIIFWSIIGMVAALFIYSVIFALNFPKNYPDETLVIEEQLSWFFNRITFPIKLAKLSLREPDEQIFVPVYGLALSGITDTWQALRPEGRKHEGQDMFAPAGTPVFSGTFGYVFRMTVSKRGGKSVYIIGNGGVGYYYAHLDRFPLGLTPGQEVTIDTVIGFVGNSGNAETTPAHLHFGMYKDRDAINPLPLLADRP